MIYVSDIFFIYFHPNKKHSILKIKKKKKIGDKLK